MGVSYRTHKGDEFSEGSRLLWLAVEAAGLNLSRAAVEAKCERADFVKYIYGDRKPGRVDSVSLFDRFAVPILAWDEAPTADFILPALRPKAAESGALPSSAADTGEHPALDDKTGTDDGRC